MSIVLEHWCCQCHRPIVDGQRWVKEKVYGSDQNGAAPAYRYYHASPFGGETLSCHEKYMKDKYAHIT